MDVDEDYDDSAEEDKKPAITNGSGPASAAGDNKAPSPTSATASTNGAAAPATKTE
jgi:hypothetical protein